MNKISIFKVTKRNKKRQTKLREHAEARSSKVHKTSKNLSDRTRGSGSIKKLRRCSAEGGRAGRVW